MNDPAHGEQSARCRWSACVVCTAAKRRQRSPTEAHHEPAISRDHGASDRAALDRNCLPLCRDCHRRRHTVGELSFWREAGLDWRSVIERMREPLCVLDEWQHVPI